MPAREVDLAIAVGFHRQTGTGVDGTTATQVQTGLAAGSSYWRPHVNDFNVPLPKMNFEDDSDFIGKGHEWTTQLFETSMDLNWPWASFLTSRNWAQVIVFALGNWTETAPGVGAAQYVCTPMDGATDGPNLPCTSILAGIRQGTVGEIIDIQAPGCVCGSFTLVVQSGPGLQNTNLTSNWIGCGKFTQNIGISYPAQATEQRLGAGSSTALTIMGVNYLSNARFVSLTFEYNNDVAQESAYHPGSGQQSNFDLRGRMRYGKRTVAFKWIAELESGSNELSNLLAGVTGSTQLKLEGPVIGASAANHTALIEFGLIRHKGIDIGSRDGLVTVEVETSIMYDPTDGPLTLTAITDLAGIGSQP